MAKGNKITVLTDEQREKILREYPTKSSSVLARETGLTNDILIGFLKRQGVYLGFERRQGLAVNGDFFKWSKDFAYVFGYMCADGSIGRYRVSEAGRKSRMVPNVSITSKDVHILWDIRGRMGLKAKPNMFMRDGVEYWKLVTRCKWVLDKWIEFGLKPRKTYVGIGIPNVPDELVPHFVRGFFDGDGCRYMAKDGTISVKFGCTDKSFLEWILHQASAVLGYRLPTISPDFNRDTPFYSFSLYSRRAKKMLDWMAPDTADLRLNRKWAA